MPTALIVEDEPEANKLLSMIVRLRGYSTVSAYTGGEALEKADHQRPDVVLLDLMLPDINGYQVCETLKSGEATSLIPVIMVTARTSDENRRRGFEAGADDYIPKPYTPEQIFRALADADAWRRQLAACESSGEFPLGRRGRDEAARGIARLRGLLRARSPLPHDAIDRLGAALEEMAASATAWGWSHESDPVATLDYRWEDERLSITIRDRAGWLGGGSQHGEGWRESLVALGFDQAVSDGERPTVTFRKRWGAP